MDVVARQVKKRFAEIRAAVVALPPFGVKIFYDPKHATHSNAKGHPETPRRVDASTDVVL